MLTARYKHNEISNITGKCNVNEANNTDTELNTIEIVCKILKKNKGYER